MLDGFTPRTVNLGDIEIFCRVAGSGSPVLLLHGFPETHVMWHRIAPQLARNHTAVCADLRGYGASSAPDSAPDHAPYSKRVMGEDMVRLMRELGYPRFGVVGHDRGGRVAYRMALDHPEHIAWLAALDIIPTSEVFARADARLILAFWPWSLLAQDAPLPEKLLLAAPDAIVSDALGSWGSDPEAFPAEVREAYIAALRNPASVHAICEEYRAAASIDTALDRQDLAEGRRIECPTLVLWSKDSGLDTWYAEAGGPLAIWRRWAGNVSGKAIAGGHFFPEQNVEDTLAELLAFIA